MYEMFLRRYIDLKNETEKMEALGNPDAFIVGLSRDLNERLMKIFKPIPS